MRKKEIKVLSMAAAIVLIDFLIYLSSRQGEITICYPKQKTEVKY